jgi:hypothetical protein
LTTDAQTFHTLAGDDLVKFGFSLVNDPKQTRGRYSDCSAEYECAGGLHLSVGFENDSGYALVFFGRLWTFGEGVARLSNYYATLAKRFAIDTPLGYPLSWGPQRSAEIAAIISDLRRTLPEVMARVTLEDLIHVEREQFGAEAIGRAHFGGSSDGSFTVSKFPVM